MHGILQRCHSTLLYSQQEQGSCTQDLQAFTPAFTEALSKIIPGVRTLYECWNKALGKKDKEMKEKKKKVEEQSDSESEEIIKPGIVFTDITRSRTLGSSSRTGWAPAHWLS